MNSLPGELTQVKHFLTVEQSDNLSQKEVQKIKQIKILVISQVHKTRIDNEYSVQLTNFAIEKLSQNYPSFKFYSHYQEQFPKTEKITCDLLTQIDFLLTVGCNETLMYAFNKYQSVNSPPILGFSVQGDSTLYHFSKCDMQETIKLFVQKIKGKKGMSQYIEEIPRIQMTLGDIKKNATCQIQISRGPEVSLVKMELYLRNKGQNKSIFISKLWGDGIVISTSFGSVSRNMMLNGPIMHKKIPCIIITPVCPLSLKFRPICLPLETTQLIIKVDKISRASGTIYIDGVKTGNAIKPGQQIILKESDLKSYMVSNLKNCYEQTLMDNLRQFLAWGEQFSSLDYKKVIKQQQQELESQKNKEI